MRLFPVGPRCPAAQKSRLRRPGRGVQRQPSFHLLRRVRENSVVKAAPLGVRGIQFVIGRFAGFAPAPRFGGETTQHARPAAVGGFVAVGMQTGVEIGNRTPRANEGGFRKSFERVSEREAKMPLIW